MLAISADWLSVSRHKENDREMKSRLERAVVAVRHGSNWLTVLINKAAELRPNCGVQLLAVPRLLHRLVVVVRVEQV